ncbi:hypothetical protein N9053_00790 [bacterium]|nr:hypothetical protein [bacterium]
MRTQASARVWVSLDALLKANVYQARIVGQLGRTGGSYRHVRIGDECDDTFLGYDVGKVVEDLLVHEADACHSAPLNDHHAPSPCICE